MGMKLNGLTPVNGAEALVRDLVFERTGLFFDDSKIDMLVNKLSPLIAERGFNSFLDYYYLLKYDADSADEWHYLIDTVSVQETYFWREMDQINGLVENLIPRLAAERPGEPIRIWSAACASGEEPLTIAMRLNEDNWFERADIRINASDASHAALRKAKAGVYSGRSFRALPAALKEKYFIPDGNNLRVAPVLHDRVAWTHANLVDPEATALLASAPIIFCRNVFIYFTAETVRSVVDSFAKRMQVPGFLFVGASESLLKVTDHFDLEELGTAFVYVKRR